MVESDSLKVKDKKIIVYSFLKELSSYNHTGSGPQLYSMPRTHPNPTPLNISRVLDKT
jgi:hypothetical protein